MPRIRKYTTSGRPSVDPWSEKMGTPARALITAQIADLLVDLSDKMDIPRPKHGKVSSDIVRLGLYRLLRHHDLITEAIDADPTWKSLRDRGLV